MFPQSTAIIQKLYPNPMFYCLNHHCPNFQMGFPMVLLWFLWVCLWFSYGFYGFVYGFPVGFYGFFHGFPMGFYGFFMVFLWFSHGFHHFPMAFPMAFRQNSWAPLTQSFAVRLFSRAMKGASHTRSSDPQLTCDALRRGADQEDSWVL